MSSFGALRRDLLAYGLFGGLSRSVNLILLPFLTRYFSPAEYGAIDVIATVTALVTVLGSLNLESAVARLWVERPSGAPRRKLVSTALATIALLAAAALCGAIFASARLSALLLHDQTSAPYLVLGVTSGLVGSLSTVPQIILRMERRIALYNLVSVLQTVLYIGGALVFLRVSGSRLLGVFLAQAASAAIALIVGLVFVRDHVGRHVSVEDAKAALDYSLPQLPSTAAVWVNAQMDRMVLLFFLGLGSVGIFGAASRLVSVMSLLAGGFQQAWTPLAIRMVDEPDTEKRGIFYARVLNYYLAILLVIALIMTSVSRELLSVLAPPEYAAAFTVVPWLAGAHVLQGSSAITNLGMLISKRTAGNSVAAWAGVVVNFALCMTLIPAFGVSGAALGMYLSAILFTSMLWRFSARSTRVHFDRAAAASVVGVYTLASAGILASYHSVFGPSSSVTARVAIVLLATTLIGASALRSSPLDQNVLGFLKRSHRPR